MVDFVLLLHRGNQVVSCADIPTVDLSLFTPLTVARRGMVVETVDKKSQDNSKLAAELNELEELLRKLEN